MLAFPIGNGVACIGRGERFTSREQRAVRSVLRFFESLQGNAGALPSPWRAATTPSSHATFAGEGLIGRSRAWKEILDQVSKAAPSNCSLVLQGETGTGKGRLARAIHAASSRSQGPFVAVNCGAIAPDLLASELFGHVRGAFTGAERNRVGLITQAHGGTLFLDELSEMPLAMQVALLRVIEDRRVMPVGSVKSRRVNLRVLGATNVDLARLVVTRKFREDLFHRLCVITLDLPPLRRRGDDLALLTYHLLAKLVPPRSAAPGVLPLLQSYAWPGNVRELDNVLRAAALLSDSQAISPEVVQDLLAQRRRQQRAPASIGPELGPRAQSVLRLLRRNWLAVPQIAQELGVSPRTINRELSRLMKLGLIEHFGEARARVYHRVNPK